LKIFQQTLIFYFQPDLACKIFIAIMIVIENLIRINRIVIEKSGFAAEPTLIPTCRNCFAVSGIFRQL